MLLLTVRSDDGSNIQCKQAGYENNLAKWMDLFTREINSPTSVLCKTPVGTGQCPVLVIETGLFETMGDLRRDALWWFCQSRDFNYVLLIDLNATNEEAI